MSLMAVAYAKINLGLEVLHRRDDGYHELVTIFQKIALADQLMVTPADDLVLTGTLPALAGSDNLCLRAARLLQAATGCRRGARLQLTKEIPVAAGLGGGSSDGALTLQLLNQLWQTGLSDQELAILARELGADVPFFLTTGATALATGIGEHVTSLPSPAPLWLLLVRPPLEITAKTARLYRALTPADWSDGRLTMAQAKRLQAAQPLATDLIHNVFQRPLLALEPTLADLWHDLQAAGATTIFPAGSGPTLIVLCDDEATAQLLAARLARPGLWIAVTVTLP